MAARIRIDRSGPITSVQDSGRFGQLELGISASGPMDRGAFGEAGPLAGDGAGAGIEFSMLGIAFSVLEGEVSVGWAGGQFAVAVNETAQAWPGNGLLRAGDQLTILPGPAGNYGYVRFAGELDIAPVLGSRATNLRARIGGFGGRVLEAGDEIGILGNDAVPLVDDVAEVVEGPIRFIWGLHAEIFSDAVRQMFVTERFRVTSMMDRMGVRLRDEAGVFGTAGILSLVSDPVVCGDIQVLGDGTPIVLGRDHQPTGGYPRIGTVISADLDRFFQLRPNSEVAFAPVRLEHAQALLRGGTV